MHEVPVNRLGGLSLPRKSVVRLTDRPDMTLDVNRGRKTTIQPIYRLSDANEELDKVKQINNFISRCMKDRNGTIKRYLLQCHLVRSAKLVGDEDLNSSLILSDGLKASASLVNQKSDHIQFGNSGPEIIKKQFYA